MTSHLRATPEQRKALNRLPLGAERIAKDTRRRKLWAKLVAQGWAEWTFGNILRRTSIGYIVSAASQQEYENRWSSENELGILERQEAKEKT